MNRKLMIPGYAQNKLPPGGKAGKTQLPIKKKAGKK